MGFARRRCRGQKKAAGKYRSGRKIEGSVSLKIFSGTARRREAITRRSLVQILPPQPRRRGRHIVRGDDFSCRTIVTSRSFCRGSFQTRSARLRGCFYETGDKVRFAPALSISRGIESTIRSALLLLLLQIEPASLGFDLVFIFWYGHLL